MDIRRWLRLPLVALVAYWTIALAFAAEPRCLLDLVDLPFHEAGHLVLSLFGETLHVLGGTLGQLAVPVLLGGYFLIHRRPFAAAFCTFWIGQNLVNISVYMADARAMALPLVGGGEHDWTNLFYRFGLLGEESVATVSSLTHHTGVLIMIAGLLWSLLFILADSSRASIGAAIAGRLPALRLLTEDEAE